MPTVLMLAYHYPPIGGAAVMRNARIARMLPRHGYEPIVVSGPGGHADYRWTPRDETLLAEPGPVVRRLAGPEPAQPRGWRARGAKLLRTRGAWERWWQAGVLAAARQVAGSVDLVHASAAPYESVGAALAVARLLDRPLVLDFEDPWALDEMRVYPTGVHRSLELRSMRRAVADADVVVMNTPEAAARVIDRLGIGAHPPVVAIPNGFDQDDFRGPQPPRAGDRFRLVHTGSFHTDMGLAQRSAPRWRRALGGAEPGVDILTRSPVPLVAALHELGRTRPDLAAHVELHLAGVLTAEDRDALATVPDVTLHGFLDHPRTIELVRSADLLFLPMHDRSAGRIGIVPCKTYEYAASGRPILAAVPDGDARDLLGELGTARLCRPADVRAIAAGLADAIEQWRAGAVTPSPRPEVLRRFEFRTLTDRLARVYDGMLRARGGPAPGPVEVVEA